MIYIIVIGFIKKINIVWYDGWGFMERGWDKAICPNMWGGVGWELNRTTTMWDKEEASTLFAIQNYSRRILVRHQSIQGDGLV